MVRAKPPQHPLENNSLENPKPTNNLKIRLSVLCYHQLAHVALNMLLKLCASDFLMYTRLAVFCVTSHYPEMLQRCILVKVVKALNGHYLNCASA